MDDKLIVKYIDACVKYGQAIEQGDSKNADKQSDIIKKIRLELKGNIECFIKKFVPLLDHENDYVKLKTAFTLLPIVTEKAEKTLEYLSSKRRILGFDASMTLKQWKKGNIDVYWL